MWNDMDVLWFMKEFDIILIYLIHLHSHWAVLGLAKTALEYSSLTLYLNMDMHIVNRFVFSILLISLTQRDIHFYHHYRWCSMGKHITRIDYWDSFCLRCRNFCSLSTDSEQKFVEFLSWFCLSVHRMNKLDAQYLPLAAI